MIDDIEFKIKPGVAARLKLTRLALGVEDQRQFAHILGIEPTLYNKFETGRRLVTIGHAVRFCDRLNVSLEWIYRGHHGSLPTHLRRYMESAPEDRVSA